LVGHLGGWSSLPLDYGKYALALPLGLPLGLALAAAAAAAVTKVDDGSILIWKTSLNQKQSLDRGHPCVLHRWA
jgi:hypothetical protein